GYSDVDLSFIPEIDYNSLDELWYNSKIEMLIISPNQSDFIDALKPLRDWKNEKGVKTIILSNFSAYEGIDDQEKIRNMIKSYYEEENIRWVLLAGDAENSLIPIREVYNPDVLRWGGGRSETVGGEYYKPTDFYYADLTADWDNDNDGEWGEAPQDNLYGIDEVSWIPEVYVGRLPADDANELEIMVNKTLEYETNPVIGDWMNNMLLAGGISDFPLGSDPDGEYESRLTNYIIQNYVKSKINYSHLIEEQGNLTRTLLISNFNNGYSTVILAGHGTPTTYYINPSTAGYYSSDASTSSNSHMPSLVYIDACSTSSYDINDNSIGETLIKRLDAGAIGVIGGLRVTWYYEDDENLEKLNRGNAKLFWREFFEEHKYQQGRALYDSKVSYINSDYYTEGSGSINYDFERKQILTYCLLGDPEVDIYTDIPKLAKNPFVENFYEAQLVSITIENINNEIVPYARVHLTSSDGKYQTVYADKYGNAKFRLPKQPYEAFNVTITGHNLIPSYFNFTTLPDDIDPIVSDIECIPNKPSTSDTIYLNLDIKDNRSGIESLYLFLSSNNFQNYTYYRLSNSFLENENQFTVDLDKLYPGIYSYFIVARDYANNTITLYTYSFKFSVPKPLTEYVLIFSLIAIIGVTGVSTFILYKGIRQYSRIRLDNV
ncbi:MAG: C25 family cysteine peptidase, partial [Promethearchaeota archaeon]